MVDSYRVEDREVMVYLWVWWFLMSRVKTYQYRKRCVRCGLMFVCDNGNREVCEECKPRGEM